MTQKGASSQACAACKYQRRRCHPDCPLAPYFPGDKPKTFQNAHKLFGVSNIMKILKHVKDDEKDEAMKSIIYEADIRQRFPVHGCSLVIFRLREQVRQCQEELHRVNSCLATLRSTQQSHSQFRHDGYVEPSDIKPAFWIQSPNYSYNDNTSNNSTLSTRSYFPQEIDIPRDFYDLMDYDTIDDERRYYKTYDTCESSNESTLNEAMKSMDAVSQNHELKITAACFSLKSVQLGKAVLR
ncbi:hypothetical protein RND81_04G225200 [Saponaria officinalis]|uniref:LOB domain-containing protein n=1 Tax=Saponaria officinalis TaxID=3572 RepID=A0AAW1LGN0_SAPOF